MGLLGRSDRGEEEGGREGGRGGAAYGGHADLVAGGDVGVGCEKGPVGLCDWVTESGSEEVEHGEEQCSGENAVEHCGGWVLDCWGMWMKGIWK